MLYIFDMGGVVTNSAVLDDKLSKVLGISVEEFERICGKKTDGANKGQLESLGLFSLCSDGIIDTKRSSSKPDSCTHLYKQGRKRNG